MDLIISLFLAVAVFTKPFWLGFGEGIIDGFKNKSK
jgi:hypothetical protein